MSTVENLYRSLSFIRQLELKVAEVYPSDKIKSPVHLSIGQEFVSVAVCEALKQSDYVAATYRGHAAYLAKGGDPEKLIAEMYGKKTGCAQGRGGSMHLIDSSVNVIGTSAVVGTGIPVATGYALTQKMKKTGNIVVCFLGDGATEEGCFYESLNFAGLHQLPILFVVENNNFAIHEPIEKRWAQPDLSKRVDGFSVEFKRHNTGDIITLNGIAITMVADIRAGKGPMLLEVDCYRWYQHVGPDTDFDQGYRSEAVAQSWVDNDPLKVLAGLLDNQTVDSIDKQSKIKVAEAFTFAEKSEFPEISELFDYVYK
jgi:pyruvate dehydrogenase E1 component alpha subunit